MKINLILNKIQQFLVRYVIVVISLIICGVCFVIGSGMKKGPAADLAAAEREQADLKNKINQCEVMMQNKQVNNVEIDSDVVVDYDATRFQKDVRKVAEFIAMPFQFKTSDEYDAKKSAFHNMICTTNERTPHTADACPNKHEIFKYILTEYSAEWTNAYNEYTSIDDGKTFISEVSSIDPYLVKITHNSEDPANDIYSYALFITINCIYPEGYEGDLRTEVNTRLSNNGERAYSSYYVMTCDVLGNGSITNFHIVAYDWNGTLKALGGMTDEERQTQAERELADALKEKAKAEAESAANGTADSEEEIVSNDFSEEAVETLVLPSGESESETGEVSE